jgi:surface antigen
MLASSNNIGDYVDKQTQREAIQDSLSKKIDEINALQKKLEKKQKETKVVLDQQMDQKAQLAAKEAEQAAIVTKTRNDEAAYQQMANDAKSQAENAAAQQRAYYDSLQQQSGGSFRSGRIGGLSIVSFSGNRGCSGGYPYCAGALDYGVDEWNLFNRECVSYAAWRIQYGYGKSVARFKGDGMAYEWEWSARKGNGSKAVAVSDPAPGDAVVLPITPGLAPVGHLMVVEGVSGDNVYVSQYNFGGTGEYSTMTISKSASTVTYLRF